MVGVPLLPGRQLLYEMPRILGQVPGAGTGGGGRHLGEDAVEILEVLE